MSERGCLSRGWALTVSSETGHISKNRTSRDLRVSLDGFQSQREALLATECKRLAAAMQVERRRGFEAGCSEVLVVGWEKTG